MDGLADVGRVRAHLYRQREFADEVTRAGADDGAAHDAVRLGIEYQLGEAFVPGIGDGATGRGPREFRNADLSSCLLRLVLGESNPGYLRIGVRHRGHDARIEMGLETRSGFRRNMPLVHRLVRKHRIARDVADGEDVRHVGAHLRIHGDEAPLIHRDARFFSADLLAIRRAADRDENHVVEARLALVE